METILRPRLAAADTETSSITTATTTPTPTSSTTQTLPTARDSLGAFPTQITTTSSTASASASATSTPDSGTGSLLHYYFVFFALILCIVGLGIFFFWRRRRMLARGRCGGRGSSRVDAQGNNNASQAGLGRWRSAEISREEGLNEHGEAPPPYIPKSAEEANRSQPAATGHEPSGDISSIPLQALSRDDGFEPPDYEPQIPGAQGGGQQGSASDLTGARHPS